MLVVAYISRLLKHFSFVFLPAAKSRMSHCSSLFCLVKLHEQWYRKTFFVGDLLPGSCDYSRCYCIVLGQFKSHPLSVPPCCSYSGCVVKAVNSVFLNVVAELNKMSHVYKMCISAALYFFYQFSSADLQVEFPYAAIWAVQFCIAQRDWRAAGRNQHQQMYQVMWVRN